MNGAREYYKLFNKACQIDRLYILPHYHARGKTFRIYVLPEGEDVVENGGCNPPLNPDAVEVYGVISGNLGWSESYGWIHDGLWREHFKSLCDTRILESKKKAEEYKEAYTAREDENTTREARLLNSYTVELRR